MPQNSSKASDSSISSWRRESKQNRSRLSDTLTAGVQQTPCYGTRRSEAQRVVNGSPALQGHKVNARVAHNYHIPYCGVQAPLNLPGGEDAARVAKKIRQAKVEAKVRARYRPLPGPTRKYLRRQSQVPNERPVTTKMVCRSNSLCVKRVTFTTTATQLIKFSTIIDTGATHARGPRRVALLLDDLGEAFTPEPLGLPGQHGPLRLRLSGSRGRANSALSVSITPRVRASSTSGGSLTFSLSFVWTSPWLAYARSDAPADHLQVRLARVGVISVFPIGWPAGRRGICFS